MLGCEENMLTVSKSHLICAAKAPNLNFGQRHNDMGLLKLERSRQ